MRSASFTLATDPTPGQQAADGTTGSTTAAFTSITITAESGLTA
jgi:hypothetical protein